jgi:CDP-glycerol glycerophosphotransferase
MTLARLLRRGWPTLSVVIPLYDVAAFLPACLDSVLGQPVRNLEVVLVDDGSTDDSAAIAQRYADRDPRVRLIRQPNLGVSVARNNGVAACTGELLTFVDPDDALPRDAWGPMVKALLRTGSDFAVGSMERVTGDGQRHRLPLLSRNHAVERLAISIEEAPLMLADVFPCNKVFRTAFWVDSKVAFPEDVRYEDQVALTEAFLAARSFDVLTEVVYDWRVRDDLSSATQKRGTLANLDDRIVTKRMTVERVRAHPAADVLLDTLVREILPIDMWEHFRAAVAPTTEQPDAYWEMLRAGVLEFWGEHTVPFERTTVPVSQRLMGWLVVQDRRDDLARLVALLDGPGVPTEGGRFRHPWYDEPGLPAELRTAD